MIKSPSFPPWSPFDGISDEQVMSRVKADGDPQAFAELVRRWERPVQRVCFRLLTGSHRAEDLTQEVFTRLFLRRRAYEPSGRFATFIFRIAVNLSLDELRRSRRRQEFPLESETENSDFPARQHESPEPAPDRAASDRERDAEVRRALDCLSEPYRVVVVLRHYEGLKFREIGELLEIPEGTVKSRMAEALLQLSRVLHPLVAREEQPRRPECLTL